MGAIAADFIRPLTIGSAEEFLQLQNILRGADFTERTVCERSGIQSIFDFEPREKDAYEPKPFRDRLDALLRVLMHGQLARESDLLAQFDSHELKVFEGLGVLARSPEDPSLIYSTAVLYPIENVYVASDRPFPPLPDWGSAVPADVVFSGISRHTRIFLASIPRDPCDSLLDLCAGSGVAGLIAGASFAKTAYTTDLGERCVHFSEFSRRLNGLENVSTAAGDLYNAVPGRMFDRIVAHPPYIPSKETSILFRDGGEDGEQIFRGVIEGLPRALAPGGRLHCVTFASDRRSGELEDRIRSWLGPDESEFDVVLVASELRNRPDYAIRNLTKGEKLKLGESGETLERLGVTRLFYGSVIVQRKPASRPAFTARTFRSPRAPLSAAEDYRRLATSLYSPECAARAFEAVPHLAPELRLTVTHQPGAEGLMPQEYSLRVDYPWITEARTESWIAVLLSTCNGTRRVGEVYDQLRLEGIMGAETTPAEFWGLLRLLAVSGYLTLAG
jgi:methyltransferase family protein